MQASLIVPCSTRPDMWTSSLRWSMRVYRNLQLTSETKIRHPSQYWWIRENSTFRLRESKRSKMDSWRQQLMLSRWYLKNWRESTRSLLCTGSSLRNISVRCARSEHSRLGLLSPSKVSWWGHLMWSLKCRWQCTCAMSVGSKFTKSSAKNSLIPWLSVLATNVKSIGLRGSWQCRSDQASLFRSRI